MEVEGNGIEARLDDDGLFSFSSSSSGPIETSASSALTWETPTSPVPPRPRARKTPESPVSICVLELYRNNFGGKIQSELGELKSLVSMDLYGNKLHGGDTKVFRQAQVPLLRVLILSSLTNLNNDLCGTIPISDPFTVDEAHKIKRLDCKLTSCLKRYTSTFRLLFTCVRESRSCSWSSSSCSRSPSKSRQTDCIFRAPISHALDHSSHYPKASKNHKPTSDATH